MRYIDTEMCWCWEDWCIFIEAAQVYIKENKYGLLD